MSRRFRSSSADARGGVIGLALAVAAVLIVGSTPDAARAQSLERAVQDAGDGTVVFEYEVDGDVELCSNGNMNWSGSWTRRSSDRGDCTIGVAQAELRVRNGVVTKIDIGPPSRVESSRGVTALDEVDAQDAADYFLRLARGSAHSEVAEDALMPAVIAEGVTVWPELDAIARDADVDDDVRESAVFWLSQIEDESALDALVSILEDSDERDLKEKAVFGISQHRSPRSTPILKTYADDRSASDDIREKAIFWLGQSDGGGEYLRDLYESLERSSLKEKVIFGVSQSGSDEDSDWLLDRALDPRESTDLREHALFWAGQSGIEAGRLANLYHEVAAEEMKEQIIFALSQSSHEEDAVEELMEIALNERDGDLQKKALFWLGQSDDPRVADFLLDLIRPRATR
jgi:HEAT repeat protein